MSTPVTSLREVVALVLRAAAASPLCARHHVRMCESVFVDPRVGRLCARDFSRAGHVLDFVSTRFTNGDLEKSRCLAECWMCEYKAVANRISSFVDVNLVPSAGMMEYGMHCG